MADSRTLLLFSKPPINNPDLVVELQSVRARYLKKAVCNAQMLLQHVEVEQAKKLQDTLRSHHEFVCLNNRINTRDCILQKYERENIWLSALNTQEVLDTQDDIINGLVPTPAMLAETARKMNHYNKVKNTNEIDKRALANLVQEVHEEISKEFAPALSDANQKVSAAQKALEEQKPVINQSVRAYGGCN